jgi:membrane peptidoglycan carboxypeptidase
MAWGSEPTTELPLIGRIDLTEAYASLRRRGKALRRRRIISAILAGMVLAGVFSVVGYYYLADIPLPNALALPQTTTVYYSDGRTVMARLGRQNRVTVDVATLPSYVSAAVVAAEDPGFFTDNGTTISRQYVRAAAGLDITTLSGQARELILASRLEDKYTKRQILGFYLNTVYFGRGSYGVAAAAQAYFGRTAPQLSRAQAVLLAGMLASPGDGRYDPTVDVQSATDRFSTVARAMVAAGTLDPATADGLRVPPVKAYDPSAFESGLDAPTGIVVQHVLAELRAAREFRGSAPGTIENGGYAIVTTVDPRAQAVLERTADETAAGSVMDGEPNNLQAAAVVIEPGTGRVRAYYGGHDGTGVDYAGWYLDAQGQPAGYGAHPPGNTMDVYTVAAALDRGISVKSTWDSPAVKAYAGRPAGDPVHDYIAAACQPTCTLADATNASLNVPLYAVAEKVTPAKVIDMARAMGIDSMWVPDSPTTSRRRYELRSGPQPSPAQPSGAESSPFGPDVALGVYPVTVEDQANAMATLAAGGLRSAAHFVARVTHGGRMVYTEPAPARQRVLSRSEAADLTWVMSQEPAGRLTGGRASATKTGIGPLRDSPVETAHAWIVGFTGNLAMAVWVGNVEIELPLHDSSGARVTGSGLPAQIYRRFMSVAPDELGLPRVGFAAPTFGGDVRAGNAGLSHSA